MRFEWDERKNRINIRKHGLDSADAWEIFTMPMLVALDDREDYGEERWTGIGMLKSRVVVVVYTERGEDTIRIIPLRKALSYECKRYEQILRDQLGAR
ncbi:MAG TPA: BrnT family toxin [Anaerolineae bacterium]|nr:BrnT family toxin [Anaerolineae bacterium]